MIQETSLEWGAFDTTTGTVSATIHKGGKRKWRILYMKKKLRRHKKMCGPCLDNDSNKPSEESFETYGEI